MQTQFPAGEHGRARASSGKRFPLTWNFSEVNALVDWVLPEQLQPRLRGGTLWIRPWRELHLTWGVSAASPGPIGAPLLGSPCGLGLTAATRPKLHIRLCNRSPETDCRVWVTTSAEPGKLIGSACIALRPYAPEWQDGIAHLDELAWEGSLDRVWIQFPSGQAGDIFVASIGVAPGSPRQRPARPDITEGALPEIHLPGISQAVFADAFAVLNEAVVCDPLPVNGFPAPFFAPGAGGAFYGNNWWVLDASLAMHPVLWTSPRFCREMMLGFAHIEEHNPDGCIQHEGKVTSRGLPCDCSVIARVFEASHAVCRASSDPALRLRLYQSLARHLGWWMSPVKRDPATSLVWSMHEESFTYHGDYGPREMAAVDTNVAVAVGARLCAELAEELGRTDEALDHRRVFDQQAAAINTWLWNEKLGCYLNWMFQEETHREILANHMFDALRFGIAPPQRRQRLYERLFDPNQFGWGRLGLTSVARQDPKFVVATGPYDGTSWNGDIWTMRNHPIIQGLRECGEIERAAELAWQTVQIFAGRWTEYIEPDGGTGHGVQRYSWTAGQWLQIVFEEIFGLRWHAPSQTLAIAPQIPPTLAGQDLVLAGMRLPDAGRTVFDVRLRRDSDGRVSGQLTANCVPEDYRLAIGDDVRSWAPGLQRWDAHNPRGNTSAMGTTSRS